MQVGDVPFPLLCRFSMNLLQKLSIQPLWLRLCFINGYVRPSELQRGLDLRLGRGIRGGPRIPR